MRLRVGPSLGPAGLESRDAVQVGYFVVNGSGCVVERLLEVFFFQEGILFQNVFAMGMGCEKFQHAAHGDAQAANAGLAAALGGFDGDAVESVRLHHEFSVPESARRRLEPTVENLGGILIRIAVRRSFAKHPMIFTRCIVCIIYAY